MGSSAGAPGVSGPPLDPFGAPTGPGSVGPGGKQSSGPSTNKDPKSTEIAVGSKVVVTAQVSGFLDKSSDDFDIVVKEGTKGSVLEIGKDKKRCLVRLSFTGKTEELWILYEKLRLE